jgi:hypothetical protein
MEQPTSCVSLPAYVCVCVFLSACEILDHKFLENLTISTALRFLTTRNASFSFTEAINVHARFLTTRNASFSFTEAINVHARFLTTRNASFSFTEARNVHERFLTTRNVHESEDGLSSIAWAAHLQRTGRTSLHTASSWRTQRCFHSGRSS